MKDRVFFDPSLIHANLVLHAAQSRLCLPAIPTPCSQSAASTPPHHPWLHSHSLSAIRYSDCTLNCSCIFYASTAHCSMLHAFLIESTAADFALCSHSWSEHNVYECLSLLIFSSQRYLVIRDELLCIGIINNNLFNGLRY